MITITFHLSGLHSLCLCKSLLSLAQFIHVSGLRIG